jgi:hypothetical protein
MARVKKKKMKLGGQNGITDQFNQILGEGELDPEIIGPKYDEIIENINMIIAMVRSFYNLVQRTSPGSEGELTMLEHKRFRWKEYLQEHSLAEEDYKVPGKLEEVYRALKKSFVIDDIMTLCGDLKPFEKYILNEDGSFIEDHPGDALEIFTNSKLNIKELYLYTCDDPAENAHNQKYILKCLSIILRASQKIYKLVTSPDIDIASVSEFLVRALVDVKKYIPRCDRAFKEIEKSIGQLEDNFGNYYKDYLETGSQTVIMENYINDIIKNNKGDLQLTRQFREIIKFLRTKVQSSGGKKDPKLRKIFDEIDAFDRKVDKKST